MVCDPNSNTINISPGPPDLLPGLGLSLSPPQIPFPDVTIPEDIPEDLLALLEQIFANMPGGLFQPNLDTSGKNVLDALASLFNQLAPYLVLYKFFQALLNMILCLVDVFCAAIFGIPRALRRLFKTCLPDFLNLFPWLALIAMILALLLLLLALIDYLIATILGIIQEILRNLEILSNSVTKGDEESVLAAVNKIAYLLCLIESLFAILIAFQAILSVIEALTQISGRSVCGRGGSSQGDDPQCCPEELCPDFVAEQPDGFFGGAGTLIYHKQLNNDLSGLAALGITLELGPIREERWQFFDPAINKEFKFVDIITPILGNIFWPEGKSYAANASLTRVPYIADMTLTLNPVAFGHIGLGGNRVFQIKDCVVTNKPFVGVLLADDALDTSTLGFDTGTTLLEGGLVFEADGVTPVNVGGTQATLNTFITQPAVTIVPPIATEDGYQINNISYNLKINHDLLFSEMLITAGCIPSVAIESTVFNATNDVRPVIDKIGPLPNVGSMSGGAGLPSGAGAGGAGTGAIGCMETALAAFRQDVSVEGGAAFQAAVEACLGDLRDETITAYNNAMIAGPNQFTNSFELVPNLQFVKEAILVKVTLRDVGNNVISFNIPAESQDVIGNLITGEPTLGTLSPFIFDGYNTFISELTSTEEGLGSITIAFDGNIFSNILNRDDADVPTQVVENVQSYEFIGSTRVAGGDDPAIRRDAGDVARSE